MIKTLNIKSQLRSEGHIPLQAALSQQVVKAQTSSKVHSRPKKVPEKGSED
jgi:hypothetical protein